MSSLLSSHQQAQVAAAKKQRSHFHAFMQWVHGAIAQARKDGVEDAIAPVAADLAADASTMSNLAARPEVYALAGRLADVGAAVRDGDWAAAEASWSAFQTEADTVEARAF